MMAGWLIAGCCYGRRCQALGLHSAAVPWFLRSVESGLPHLGSCLPLRGPVALSLLNLASLALTAAATAAPQPETGATLLECAFSLDPTLSLRQTTGRALWASALPLPLPAAESLPAQPDLAFGLPPRPPAACDAALLEPALDSLRLLSAAAGEGYRRTGDQEVGRQGQSCPETNKWPGSTGAEQGLGRG